MTHYALNVKYMYSTVPNPYQVNFLFFSKNCSSKLLEVPKEWIVTAASGTVGVIE